MSYYMNPLVLYYYVFYYLYNQIYLLFARSCVIAGLGHCFTPHNKTLSIGVLWYNIQYNTSVLSLLVWNITLGLAGMNGSTA